METKVKVAKRAVDLLFTLVVIATLPITLPAYVLGCMGYGLICAGAAMRE